MIKDYQDSQFPADQTIGTFEGGFEENADGHIIPIFNDFEKRSSPSMPLPSSVSLSLRTRVRKKYKSPDLEAG